MSVQLQLLQGQHGSSQSSGKSSQSQLTLPLHDAGRLLRQVSPEQAGLPAQTDSAQHAGLLQSLAVQGQQAAQPPARGLPPETPKLPRGQVAVSPVPLGHEQPGPASALHCVPQQEAVRQEKKSRQPGRPLQLWSSASQQFSLVGVICPAQAVPHWPFMSQV